MKNHNASNTNPELFFQQKFREIPELNPAPHCVNPECISYHHKNIHDTSWRTDHGSYETKAFGTVPRYRCLYCGKTFSDQSFKIDYYVKKPIDYVDLLKPLLSTSGQGNAGRFAGVRYELIQNRCERLSRMFLAMHARLREKLNVDEDFAFDGFESFSGSQYYPNNINIVAGAESEFIYGMGFAQLRRKGRMTNAQKQKREKLEEKYGKAAPNAVEMSTYSLFTDLANLLQRKDILIKTIKTDEHRAYPRAFKRILDFAGTFRHTQYSSKAARTFSNPLFPVNYIDRQLRKDQVNHVRETVQFARCPSAMMVRLSLYQMYHNYIMPRRVKEQRKGNSQTRAEFMGLAKTDIISAIGGVWARRVFFHKYDLWEEEKKTWLMQWRNSNIRMGRRVPEYIFS